MLLYRGADMNIQNKFGYTGRYDEWIEVFLLVSSHFTFFSDYEFIHFETISSTVSCLRFRQEAVRASIDVFWTFEKLGHRGLLKAYAILLRFHRDTPALQNENGKRW
jgi:hypothetical protein